MGALHNTYNYKSKTDIRAENQNQNAALISVVHCIWTHPEHQEIKLLWSNRLFSIWYFSSSRLLPASDFGYQRADQTWSGTVGLLEKGEADVAPVLLTATASRERVIDILDPLVISRTVLSFKKQLKGSTDFVHFLRRDSFFGLAGLLVFGCLLSVVASRVHGVSSDFPALATYGSMVNQGVSSSFLTAASMKILFLTMFLLGICTTGLFSARLSSLLTIEKSVPLVRSLYDVVDKDLDFIVPGRDQVYPQDNYQTDITPFSLVF